MTELFSILQLDLTNIPLLYLDSFKEKLVSFTTFYSGRIQQANLHEPSVRSGANMREIYVD